MSNTTDDMFRIGVITTTHGLKGEVKVFPTTDSMDRFKSLKKCFIKTKKELIEVEKKSCKFFKNMVILSFKGYDTIEQIEGFRQCEIYVTREDAVPLQEDEFYIADVIDMDVCLEDGTKFGVLKDVLQTGANDVFSVELPDGKEVLMPVIKDCVKDIDYDNNIVTINLMKGILD